MTKLPGELIPTAPRVLYPSELTQSAFDIEGMLATRGLNVTNTNPLYSDSAPAEYRQKYFDFAIKPHLDSAKIGQYLGGRLRPGGEGSTLAAAYLSNLHNQGAREAFFAGEDYRNLLHNQLLGRRDAFFGQSYETGQQYNARDIQRALALNDQYTGRLGMMNDTTTQRLGMLNTFQLGTQANFANAMNAGFGRQMQRAALNAEAEAARAANFGNLVGGVFGLGGGLASGVFGRRRQAARMAPYSQGPFSGAYMGTSIPGIGMY